MHASEERGGIDVFCGKVIFFLRLHQLVCQWLAVQQLVLWAEHATEEHRGSKLVVA